MLGGGGLLLADGCKDDATLIGQIYNNCSKHLQDPANLTSGNLTLLMPIQRLQLQGTPFIKLPKSH